MKQFLISYDVEFQDYPDNRYWERNKTRIVHAMDERGAEVKLKNHYEKNDDPYGKAFIWMNIHSITEAII
jgi:hypothetical protein